MSTPSPRQSDAIDIDDRMEGASQHELRSAAQVFLAERTQLLRTAYRVVGDWAEAEDIVQEAWLRWQRLDRRQIRNAAALLSTATTHLAINVLQSAQHRHEVVCQPLAGVVVRSADPADDLERFEQLERALAFLMAKLSPAQLAALLLRKCFDYPYGDIADLLGTSTPNSRQLVRRAHLGLRSLRWRDIDGQQHRGLVDRFRAASDRGDMDSLVSLLVANAGGNRSREALPEPRPGPSSVVSAAVV
jgi:RNA polymerase sigma factor (sigma-70 family)